MEAPMQLPRERVPYSAIVDRPKLNLPDGGRLVVVDDRRCRGMADRAGDARTVLPPPMGQPLLPDLPNWAWHEYGMRVGFWRLLGGAAPLRRDPDFRDKRQRLQQLPADRRGRARRGCREFMGHGFVQGPMHRLDDQRGAIRDTIETIRRFTGTAPRGWESPA